MHELSIATQIVETLETELSSTPGRIDSVQVDVGVLSGVVPDALAFAWDAARSGTRLAEASLRIREIDVVVHCPACGTDHELPGIDRLRCPVCGTSTPEIVAGRELHIRSVDVSEPGSSPTEP